MYLTRVSESLMLTGNQPSKASDVDVIPETLAHMSGVHSQCKSESNRKKLPFSDTTNKYKKEPELIEYNL